MKAFISTTLDHNGIVFLEINQALNNMERQIAQNPATNTSTLEFCLLIKINQDRLLKLTNITLDSTLEDLKKEIQVKEKFDAHSCINI